MKRAEKKQNLEELTHKLLKKYENILGEDLNIAHVDEIIERIINYHESIIDHMPGNVFWLDKNCVAIGCNKNVLNMFGFKSIADFKGLTFEEMGRLGNWNPQAIESFKKDTLEVIKTGKGKLNIEEPPIPHHDGRTIYFLTSRVPLFNRGGKVVGVVGISIDITERKEMEKNLKIAMRQSEIANQAKSEFISNMSHDVKTPLSGIISFSEILSSRVQEEYRPIIHDILEASKNLMAFFENCIGLARSGTGSIVLVKEAFNLKHLLNEIAVLLQPTIKAKNLAFHIDYDEKIPPQLLGSRVTLYRILLNLLGNAIKFTSEGSVSFQAELEQKSTADPITIKFTIADTGIGIPADQQELIFERFTRLTPSYEGVYEGSGIGLYIVKEFVKAMHGEIDLKSEKGKGSQFTVTVPFEVSLAADDAHDSEDNTLSILTPSASSALTTASTSANILPIPLESSANQTLSPKILLVEDSLLAKNSIVMVLNSLGYEVDVAECGAEAVALFVPGKYALVFMDIGLPDIKGYQITERLRAMEQGTVFYTPILGLSAHITQEESYLSMAAGMDEMHTKPLLLETAKLLVKKYIIREKSIHNKNVNSS